MRLGIYGGTFSPIHYGHIRAAKDFLGALELDRLLIIPTATPPHKAAVIGASAKDRLEMARIAFYGADSRIEVSDFEISRGGKSYTVNTLKSFAPGNELYMLVGTDMFLTLDSWFESEKIFELSDIVLMRREDEPETSELIQRKTYEYKSRFGARIHFIDDRPFPVSSTALRAMISAGEDIRSLVPDGVAEYIEKNALYKEKSNDH